MGIKGLREQITENAAELYSLGADKIKIVVRRNPDNNHVSAVIKAFETLYLQSEEKDAMKGALESLLERTADKMQEHLDNGLEGDLFVWH